MFKSPFECIVIAQRVPCKNGKERGGGNQVCSFTQCHVFDHNRIIYSGITVVQIPDAIRRYPAEHRFPVSCLSSKSRTLV